MRWEMRETNKCQKPTSRPIQSNWGVNPTWIRTTNAADLSPGQNKVFQRLGEGGARNTTDLPKGHCRMFVRLGKGKTTNTTDPPRGHWGFVRLGKGKTTNTTDPPRGHCRVFVRLGKGKTTNTTSPPWGHWGCLQGWVKVKQQTQQTHLEATEDVCEVG